MDIKSCFVVAQDDPDREIEYLRFLNPYNVEGLIIAI